MEVPSLQAVHGSTLNSLFLMQKQADMFSAILADGLATMDADVAKNS